MLFKHSKKINVLSLYVYENNDTFSMNVIWYFILPDITKKIVNFKLNTVLRILNVVVLFTTSTQCHKDIDVSILIENNPCAGKLSGNSKCAD